MTASPSALAALVTAARLVSAVTTGKAPRGDLPKPVREALARMDGALARIDAEERMGGAK